MLFSTVLNKGYTFKCIVRYTIKCIIALTGFAPVSSGSKPDMLVYYTIGLGDTT